MCPVNYRARRNSRPRPHIAVWAAAFIAVTVVGCGSSDNGATSTTPPPVPGVVTLDLSEATEAQGLVMLSLIGKNLPQQPMAAACAIVDSDPYGFTGEFFPIAGPDPCSLESEPLMLDPGTYSVVVAVMPGGSTSPDQCAEAEVTVNGDVTVEITALGPPTECDF